LIGWEFKQISKAPKAATDIDDSNIPKKVNYACGKAVMEGWLNVDIEVKTLDEILAVDLTKKHPFKDSFFEFSFCEDFIEHLSQADSLIFLSEAYRTLKPGGVFRLSFPCLDGQCLHGPKFSDYESSKAVKDKYYEKYSHLHLYAKQEFELVCKHIGFRKIEFKEFGESDHPELRSLEWRDHVKHYNAYIELTK
jgi:SAM-dependent methyltransferase